MSETALPSVEAIKEATLKAFKGKVKDDDIERLLLSLDASSFAANTGTFLASAASGIVSPDLVD